MGECSNYGSVYTTDVDDRRNRGIGIQCCVPSYTDIEECRSICYVDYSWNDHVVCYLLGTCLMAKRKITKADRLAAAAAAKAKLLKKVGYKGGGDFKVKIPCYKINNDIPLSNTICYNDNMSKRKANEYTGDVIIGIATMHKSNAVPVTNTKNAEEIAKMRR